MALEIRVHPKRGRGLWTTRDVLGGETVLVEPPAMLLVGSKMWNVACATCMRTIKDQPMQACQGCQQASFCSAACMQQAQSTPWLHGPHMCSIYKTLAAHASGTAGGTTLDEQDVDAGRFLAHAMALHSNSASSPQAGAAASTIASLQGTATEVEERVVARLTPILQAAIQGPLPLSPRDMADLLRKEQFNSYGILAPLWYTDHQAAVQGSGAGMGDESDSDEEGWGRVLRGSALYGLASLINHECNPNVARFDSFDVQGPTSTSVVFRAMHDLPAGTEVMQSYCPVAWDYEDRQQHCQEVYGFTCECQRCKLEKTWSLAEAGGPAKGEAAEVDMESSGDWETDEGEDMTQEAGASTAAGQAEGSGGPGGSSSQDPGPLHHPVEHLVGSGNAYVRPVAAAQPLPVQAKEGAQEPLDPMYLQLYLLKYVCAVPGCFGTLAPQAPGSHMLECAVCGALRSEAQFLQELEA